MSNRPSEGALTEAERSAVNAAACGNCGERTAVMSLVARIKAEAVRAERERLTALRDEIAGEIEAHGERWDHSADWRCGVDEAADIARGTVR